MHVHIENQLGFVGYDVSIVGYCRVWYGILHMHAWLSVMMLVYGGMVCYYGMMLVCYVMVCYCMLVWYDVSIIGYCKVWLGMILKNHT